MARVALPESKMRSRRRRRRLLAATAAAALLLLIVGGFMWLAQASALRISAIHINGAQTVATSTIEEYVWGQLAGDYFYFFPKNNIFFYPKGAIASGLLEAMPTLASVSLSAENFHTIAVSVVEREPKALWCGTDTADPVPCFLLDENGVAYRADLSFTPTTGQGAYTNYYGLLTGSTTPKQYVSPAEFHSLSALVDTIAASQKNQTLSNVWVDGNKDVRMAFASGFTLLFTLAADGGDVYQRFTLALQSDPFKQHALSDFEYLDLRFGDKLYYKLK